MRALMLAVLVLGIAAADERSDALEAVAPLAAALSEGDAGRFIRHVPSTASNYEELRANVQGLIDAAEVTSSVEVRKASRGAAELDWYMEVRSRATRMIVERRRGIVRIEVEKTALRTIEPASFFAPPKAAR